MRDDPMLVMGGLCLGETMEGGPPARGLDSGKMSGLKDVYILQVSACSSDKSTINTLRVSKKAAHTRKLDLL